MSSHPPFVSHSVPSSPAIPRSTNLHSSLMSKGHPVTPQRLPRLQQPRTASATSSLSMSSSSSSSRHHRSPGSPYTPLSLRSSSDSSTLTTPDSSNANNSLNNANAQSDKAGSRSSDNANNVSVNNVSFLARKRLGGNVSADSLGDKDAASLADLAQNWRARASQHGIKVSVSSKENGGHDGSLFGDDEASDKTSSDIGNDSSFFSATDESLLPPPFMSYHRRAQSQSTSTPARPRAHSHSHSHSSMIENQAPDVSPIAARRANATMPLMMSSNMNMSMCSPVRTRKALGAVSSNIMSTPPPNRALESELKLKGSRTEPAQPRRREPFGAVPMLSNNVPRGSTSMNYNLNHDASLDLFNINEHDYEYENGNETQNADDLYDESFSLDLQSHTANIFGYSSSGRDANSNNNSNSNSRSPFSSYNNNTANGFSDPFFDAPSGYGGGHVLNTISESAEHHFHSTATQATTMNFTTYPSAGQFNDSMFGQGYMPKPAFVPLPQPPPMQHQHQQHVLPPPARAYRPMPPGLNPFAPAMPIAMPAPALAMPVPALAMPVPAMPTPSPASATTSVASAMSPGAPPADSPTDCSVCLASHPASLAVLQPCGHPLCSGCLTSALNIVGEKDMQCAVCARKVADFRLVSVARKVGGVEGGVKRESGEKEEGEGGKGVFGEEGMLEGAFEFDFEEVRASTPRLEVQRPVQNAVLRIDNVPWDITPRQIAVWLQQPVERVHVLLDGKGKTMSHAYVEVGDVGVAGAILRGETGGVGGRRERGSVLGRGKRARGVTVTRSCQEELMANLFPHWRGRFEGSRPVVVGEGRGFEGGLLSEGEVNSLRHLIQSPDSHFLKVPVLPFHSLVSLLSKFPGDNESRAFWAGGVRDKLFDLACVGIRELVARVERARKGGKFEDEHRGELVCELAEAALGCRVFTAEQARRFREVLEEVGVDVPEVEREAEAEGGEGMFGFEGGSDGGVSEGEVRTPVDFGRGECVGVGVRGEGVGVGLGGVTPSFVDLAREFGVEADLVKALAQRLAGL
ncbi:hypothetical protein D9611_014193 [Ephemerocybe angulata]|uniref:RING-type domain-containing protein n=1 Tax=Ephemerocybe angulata TaxID=980116 RepID=A0A8H5CAE2_9AGAR|nr:hypothetical protein D9611_014193 [Tulosesus angulatus]